MKASDYLGGMWMRSSDLEGPTEFKIEAVAVGEIDRIQVRVAPGRELAQSSTVRADFVKVICLFRLRHHAEEHMAAVV